MTPQILGDIAAAGVNRAVGFDTLRYAFEIADTPSPSFVSDTLLITAERIKPKYDGHSLVVASILLTFQTRPKYQDPL